MIHVTCFKCRRRFDLDPVLVGIDLRKLKTKNPRFYQAVCPACQSVNKVSVKEMQEDLDAVEEQIETEVKAAAAAKKTNKKGEKAKEND